MKQNLLHIIIILLLGFTSCIKPYEPDFKSEAIQKYVVEGMVSSEEGWQTVTVSISSTANSPMFIPLANCYVEIIDELGQKFELNYVENGQYRVWMSSEYLVPGRAYQTRVITSEGDI
ncbi:MAG: DUF4249 family protein, partial [Bacteroidales bacterium]|nr:DUF4249 family protein [Bacteroidales bacterium]